MPRLRLAIAGDSPCGSCAANCCKQNGHAYAVLLQGDERRRFAAFSVDVPIDAGAAFPTVERVITYRDGRCPFLGGDDSCTIYDDRPESCRAFQCVSGYHLGGADLGRHSTFLRRNPDVLRLLESL
jgi:Fe-S-cluster containining protein